MPRTKTEINSALLEKLKLSLIESTGTTLKRSVDCDKLAETVSNKTSTHINGISFKRLFGFTKYPFNPSIQTLDIICQFLGFDNWYSFEQHHANNVIISKKEIEIYSSCFDIDFVNDIEPHEGAFQSVSRKIAHRFREDPHTFIRYLPELMVKKQFQIFFAEHFPDYDNLCAYYYLVYESYLQQKKSKEAQLFANCMLFLKSFWMLEKQECSKYLNEINKINLNYHIHPYLIGRYFACNLLFDSFFNESNEFSEIYNDYLELRIKLPKDGKHFYDFPASEYIVSEALLHCKQFEKCKEIIDFVTKEFTIKMEFVRKGYYRQLQLIWLLASKKLNPNLNIGSQLEKVQPENFYFISQKYFSTLYYYAKGTPVDLEKAKNLAIETGNQYFLEVFLNEC
jgi:hypothetical protein